VAIYSVYHGAMIATVSAAAIDIKAGSAAPSSLYEVSLCNLGAALTLGIGRPGNDGSVTQTSPVLLQSENPADPACATSIATTWSVAPTTPTVFFRRYQAAATAGHGIIWTFPRGLNMPATKGVVIWNIAVGNTTTQSGYHVEE
jgi:hypothetical protein